jgi:hypothetical protein
MMRARDLVLAAMLLAGCAGVSTGPVPSAAVTTAVQGWERYFRLDWTGQATPRGMEIDGYIYNTYGSPAANVRVLAQALDPQDEVIAQKIEWVPGVVPNFSRSYFKVSALPAAAAYRVTVWSFDIVETDRDHFLRRRF